MSAPDDHRITPSRVAAFFALINEQLKESGIREESAAMNGHKVHNHTTRELLPVGECPRCDWLHEQAAD